MKFGTQTVLQGKSLDQFEMSLHGQPWGEKNDDLFMATVWNSTDVLFLPCSFFYLLSFFVFSLPNVSRHRLDVYHTFTHGVVLVRI